MHVRRHYWIRVWNCAGTAIRRTTGAPRFRISPGGVVADSEASGRSSGLIHSLPVSPAGQEGCRPEVIREVAEAMTLLCVCRTCLRWALSAANCASAKADCASVDVPSPPAPRPRLLRSGTIVRPLPFSLWSTGKPGAAAPVQHVVFAAVIRFTLSPNWLRVWRMKCIVKTMKPAVALSDAARYADYFQTPQRCIPSVSGRCRQSSFAASSR